MNLIGFPEKEPDFFVRYQVYIIRLSYEKQDKLSSQEKTRTLNNPNRCAGSSTVFNLDF
jgi:hypothetical protein